MRSVQYACDLTKSWSKSSNRVDEGSSLVLLDRWHSICGRKTASRKMPFQLHWTPFELSALVQSPFSIDVHLNLLEIANRIWCFFLIFSECWVAWPVGTCPQDGGALHRPFASEIIWRHWMKPMVRQKCLREGGALLQPATIKVVPLFKRDWN